MVDINLISVIGFNNLNGIISISLISDDEVLVEFTKSIEIINFKNCITISRISSEKLVSPLFCWIEHSEQVLLIDMNVIKTGYLYSKDGQLQQEIILCEKPDCYLISLDYIKESQEIALLIKLKGRSSYQSLVLFDNNFKEKIINKYESNDIQFYYPSKFQFQNVLYNLFKSSKHNLVFLQEDEDYNRNVYIFDLNSFSIIDSIRSEDRLMMVVNDKIIFKSNFNLFKIYKIRFMPKKSFEIDTSFMCKLSSFDHRLLRNSVFLPCGNKACLECIYNHYNFYNEKFKWVFKPCKQEHQLSELNFIEEKCKNLCMSLLLVGSEILKSQGI